jgi:hypothetical protein
MAHADSMMNKAVDQARNISLQQKYQRVHKAYLYGELLVFLAVHVAASECSQVGAIHTLYLNSAMRGHEFSYFELRQAG